MLSHVAQVVLPGTDWGALIAQWGILGVVLVWFMLRTEGLLKANTNALDRMARANLLLVISLKQANDASKTEAGAIIKELDEAKARDGK